MTSTDQTNRTNQGEDMYKTRSGWGRLLASLIALTTMLALFAGCGDDDDGAATGTNAGGDADAGDDGNDGGGAETLVIADLESLTGAAASVGVPQANAVELAVSEINEAGGIDVGGTTYTIELDTQDDQSDPTAGVTAVQGFISDGRKFMFGTLSSAVVGAYMPILEGNDDFISIVMGAALEGITDVPAIYRPRVTLSQYTEGLSDYLEERGDIETIAMLTDQQHAGFVEQLGPLQDRLEDAGIETVADESYTFGATEFGAQLQSMLRGNPDALNFRGYPADVTRAIKQAREQGFDGPIFTTSGITAAEVDDAQAAGQMDGVIEVYAPLPSDLIEGGVNAERAEAFETAYEEMFGEPSGGTSMSAYDGVFILARALEKAGTVDDVAAVRDALDELTIEDVPELVEPIRPQEGGRIFDERQAYFELVVREWQDGAFHPTDFIG